MSDTVIIVILFALQVQIFMATLAIQNLTKAQNAVNGVIATNVLAIVDLKIKQDAGHQSEAEHFDFKEPEKDTLQ